MSVKTIYSCDCCGRDVNPGDYDPEVGRVPVYYIGSDFLNFKINTRGFIKLFHRRFDKKVNYISYELCYNCYIKITKMIKKFVSASKINHYRG
jgi:hypothetical protein